LYEVYYKNIGEENIQVQVRKQLVRMISKFGLENSPAEELADFILRIRPTYGQMREWKTQLADFQEDYNDQLSIQMMDKEMMRSNRFILSLDSANINSKTKLRIALVRDTHKDPLVADAIQTWPFHSSAAYLFDDIFLDKDTIMVNKFSLLPAIVSTAGAPEKILGTELVRDITAKQLVNLGT